MKKMISFVLAVCLACGLMACGSTSENAIQGESTPETAAEETSEHKIGVLVYNRTDEEVIAFKEYLENYIESCFEDVDFIYSDSITTSEEELAFIKTAAENGVEGIMSFISYDLEAEVKKCEEYGIYYMLASGSVSDESFAAVAENPYFLGVVGPGKEIEYQAGVDMANYFAEIGGCNEYFILSGGSFMGNEMHKLRTEGILDRLQEFYGVTFEQSTEELAASEGIIHAQAGDLTVCICPGYLTREIYLEAAKAAYEKDPYGVVMAVQPILDFQPLIEASDAKLGLVDCYTTRNWQLFTAHKLNYLTGKYMSIIGPSFAAMYNAVNGYAEDFREADGKAFQVIQGFWNSESPEDFEKKYEMSSSIAINAYNYEDLYNVCKSYNPDAALQDLKELAGAYTFEDAQARRAE